MDHCGGHEVKAYRRETPTMPELVLDLALLG
jgi:hypothetical protein